MVKLLSSGQLIQQCRRRLFFLWAVTIGDLVMDRLQHCSGLLCATRILPQAGKVSCGAKLPQSGSLFAGRGKGRFQVGFSRLRVSIFQRQSTLKTTKFSGDECLAGFGKHFAGLHGKGAGLLCLTVAKCLPPGQLRKIGK